MGAPSGDGNMTRLDLVKKEFAKSIKGRLVDARKRKSGDRFRVASFSSGCSCFPNADERSFKFDSPEDCVKAKEFVDGLSSCGNTAMKYAWETIIPIIRKEKIRSVYFLSDGDPNDCNAAILLDLLKKEVPKLTIHTFSMGQSSQLLKDIAKQHDGQYREIF